MIIQSPSSVRTVISYEITFVSGHVLEFVIDPTFKDFLREENDKIYVYLAEKPGPLPDQTLPAEEITIRLAQVETVRKREQQISARTPEQQEEWRKTLQELSGTLQ